MRKRGLLIGCQTGDLRGVHADVELMARTLGSFGFVPTSLVAERATRRGIINAYRTLVAGTSAGDAVVVYYSGHGGMIRNPRPAGDYSSPGRLQFLCPTDIGAPDDGSGFNGLLADELSELQWQLSERTANVTTIIDSCHAARMARDGTQVPKADPRAGAGGWNAALQAWRALGRTPSRAGRAESNPSVVRLVACAPDASAYEVRLPGFDCPHGLLTATLTRLLSRPGSTRMTWRSLIGLLRPAVMDVEPSQRPEIEGPADRRLFESTERQATGVLPVLLEQRSAVLESAALFGVGVGDTYAVVPADGSVGAPLTTAVVERIVAGRAVLRLDSLSPADLPAGIEAHPLEVALGRRPVAVLPPDHPRRDAVVTALASVPHLRIAEDDEPVMATVALKGGLRLLDAHDEPLCAAPVPLTDAAIGRIGLDLRQLARAAHLRALPSGSAAESLPADVSLTGTRLLGGGGEEPLDAAGEHLFSGDQVVVRIHSHSSERRFVSVFDVGLRGTISPLTSADPSGVGVEPGGCHELYRLPGTHRLVGVELYWPDELPRGASRPESFVAIVTDRPQDLSRLVQPGLVRRSAAGSALQRLVEDIAVGVRDARVPAGAVRDGVPYRVLRLDFRLHPERRPGPEPAFDIDQRPDPSYRLVVPRATGPVPKRVAVRLREAVVHRNRALRTASVRIDSLVVTRSSGEPPYRSTTHRIDGVRDGERLPLDNLLLYEGPVDGFLDLALWISRDNSAGADLAGLLAQAATGGEVAEAVAVLGGLALAAPQAAAVATTVGAVAVLVRTGAALLDRATGKSIGVYRTSLLPHERFGAGDPVGRHPTADLLRARDMSFSYEVVDVARR